MTDIKLRRRRKPIWPWIAGLVILVALGWGVVEVLEQKAASNNSNTLGSGRKSTNNFREFAFDEEIKDKETQRNSRDINEFVQFVTESESYGTGNAFEAEGLNKLADAIESMSMEMDFDDDALDEKLNSIRSKSQYILENGNGHGDSARVAITDIVDAFEIIQLEKFPEEKRKIDALENTIKYYSPSENERNHREDLQEFFNQSAYTIEAFSMEYKNDQVNN